MPIFRRYFYLWSFSHFIFRWRAAINSIKILLWYFLGLCQVPGYRWIPTVGVFLHYNLQRSLGTWFMLFRSKTFGVRHIWCKSSQTKRLKLGCHFDVVIWCQHLINQLFVCVNRLWEKRQWFKIGFKIHYNFPLLFLMHAVRFKPFSKLLLTLNCLRLRSLMVGNWKNTYLVV